MFGYDKALDLSPKEVKAKLDRGDKIVLLDVREPAEDDIARIEGRVLIPLADLPQRVGELDPSAEIIAYCQAGIRSMKAAQFLRKQGFNNCWNMAGGIDLWSVEVDPSVPRYR